MSTLQFLNTPRQCEIPHCRYPAEWQFDQTAVCYRDMENMASMNSDNAIQFSDALRKHCSVCGDPTPLHCPNCTVNFMQCSECALQTDMGPHCNWCEAELVEEKAKVPA